MYCSPHLCVGFLFLVLHSRLLALLLLLLPPPPPPPPPPQQLVAHNLLTHNLSTHNLSTHNLLTQLVHTTPPHTTSPHNFSIHPQLVHTTCTHTHNFSTHNLLTHHLLTHNLSTHNFAWQARHLATCTCILRGRRGTYGTGLALVARLVPSWRVDAAAVCVAGVALGDIERHFAWQAWHLATCMCILRGRRGTYGTGLALVAGLVPSWRPGCRRCVVLGDIDRHFAWQAWRLATSSVALRGRRGTYGTGLALVARLVPSWRRGRRRCLRGRRGTWRYRPSLCVAGAALGDIDRRFACQAWHLVTWTSTLHGSRGTYGTGLALVAHLVPSWRRGRRRCLCGRHGTWRHRASLCVAGVALCDIYLRFAWRAWHSWHWAGSHPSLTHHFVTHHLSHTTLSHAIFDTPLCHTPSFTHHLCHTTLSHTIFHTSSFTPLYDTPSFTHHLSHNFVTHHLPHTIFHHTCFHTQLCHTPSLTHPLSHTTLSPTTFDTPSFTHNFVTHHL